MGLPCQGRDSGGSSPLDTVLRTCIDWLLYHHAFSEPINPVGLGWEWGGCLLVGNTRRGLRTCRGEQGGAGDWLVLGWRWSVGVGVSHPGGTDRI